MRRTQKLQRRSSSSSVNSRDPHRVVLSQLRTLVSFHGCCQRSQPQFKLGPGSTNRHMLTCDRGDTTPSVSLCADLRQLSSSAGNWARNQAAEGVRAGEGRNRKKIKFGVFICFCFDVIFRQISCLHSFRDHGRKYFFL